MSHKKGHCFFCVITFLLLIKDIPSLFQVNISHEELTCADPGIFVRGGPGQSDKKALTTFFFFFSFSPQLIFTEVKWSISKKSIIFQGFRGGPTFSRGGGVQLFPGGSNCLFPIETHITCDFPGGSGPLVSPLDPHLTTYIKILIWSTESGFAPTSADWFIRIYLTLTFAIV